MLVAFKAAAAAAVVVVVVLAVATASLLLFREFFCRLVATLVSTPPFVVPIVPLFVFFLESAASLEVATLSRDIASAYGLCSTSLRLTSLACGTATEGDGQGVMVEYKTKRFSSFTLLWYCPKAGEGLESRMWGLRIRNARVSHALEGTCVQGKRD